jgi:hypothetical protein
MTERQVRDKNKSQIVFDIQGGEDSFQTMTLRTIPNRPHLIKSRAESFSLRTDDIEGAQWRPRKPATHDFQLNTTDIDGASPAPSYDPNKPAIPIMSVDDIEGAKPRIQRQLPHSRRQTNPLNPEYSLPSYEEPPPPVPRFLRDGFRNDDIPGTHSRSWQLPYGPRDNMRVADGPGCHPRKRVGKLMQSSVDRMNVRDINNDGIYKTTRLTDPLNPVYFYDGGPCAARGFGRAFPRPEPRNVPTFSLQTDDIAGAKGDSSTQWYRRFKEPPPEKEEGEGAPGALLMLPSMEKQTRELEKQEAIRKMRGEKFWFYENRHLRGARGSGDALQGALRQQRPKMNPERITLSPS